MKGKFVIIHFPPRIADEKEHRKSACHRRGDGSSCDAEFGKSEVTQNEQVVEHHVAQHHHDRVELEGARLRSGDEERAKQTSHHAEVDAPHAPPQIGPSGFVNLRITDDARQQIGTRGLDDEENHRGSDAEER